MLIPWGGQIAPMWTDGIDAKWISAQKIEKKNMTSDTIDKMNPMRSPAWTLRVWWPFSDSSDTFWPQNANRNTNVKKSANVGTGLFQRATKSANTTPGSWIGKSGCDKNATCDSKSTIAAATNNGSGVASTMWNGCCSAFAVWVCFNLNEIIFWHLENQVLYAGRNVLSKLPAFLATPTLFVGFNRRHNVTWITFARCEHNKRSYML